MRRTDDSPLLFYDFGPGVTAFSTSRHGGVSMGNYGTFNVNAYCGDDVAAITRNRQLLCQWLHLGDERNLIIPHQTHGTAVCKVDETFLSLSEEARRERLEGVDAVMTDVPQVCIGVSTADCTPIIIFDEDHQAACAVHAGWRGTVARIVLKAVEAMGKAYGSRPKSMRAVIGPCISLRHFEVGQEVYDQFSDAGFPMDRIAVRYEKWHIDLQMCNWLQLQEAGVQVISKSDICTYECVDDFFSARRMGINSGRIFTGVLMQG